MASVACQDEEFFLTLLDFLPSKEAVVVLHAYLDESERTSGTFCVAGYAFVPKQARKFIKEWSALFGAAGCHMVELLARQGRFKGISEAERDRLLCEAVKIIKKRISFGVAVSCNVAEVMHISPTWIRGMGHAYPLCCHLSMMTLGQKIIESGSSERVTYVFEAGHEYEAEARDFVRSMARCSEAKESYRHSGDAFLPKTDAVPLQAADMLAWEWAKFEDETLALRLRPMRKSLRALVDGSLKQYCGMRVTGRPLVNFMYKVTNLGLLQRKEEYEESASLVLIARYFSFGGLLASAIFLMALETSFTPRFPFWPIWPSMAPKATS